MRFHTNNPFLSKKGHLVRRPSRWFVSQKALRGNTGTLSAAAGDLPVGSSNVLLYGGLGVAGYMLLPKPIFYAGLGIGTLLYLMK